MVCLGVVPINRVRVPAAAAAAPFVPANSLFWVDASQQGGINNMPLGILADNSNVTRSYTVSGLNSLTFLSANRNGNAVLSSNGTNSPYLGSSTASVPVNQPFLGWVVAKVTADSEVFGADSGANASQFRLKYSGDTILQFLSGGFSQSNLISWADWNIIMFHRNAAGQIRLYNGGVQVNVANVVSSAIDISTLFRLYGLGFTGLFGEAGLQLGDFTNAQINALGNSLGSKWAIVWTNL